MPDLNQIVAEAKERLRLVHAARTAFNALRRDDRRMLFAELAGELQEEESDPPTTTRRTGALTVNALEAGAIGGIVGAMQRVPATLRAAITRVLKDAGAPLGSGQIYTAVTMMMPLAKKDSVSSEVKRMKDDSLIVEAGVGENGWPVYKLAELGPRRGP